MDKDCRHPLIEKLLESTTLLKDVLIQHNPEHLVEAYTIVAVFRDCATQQERDALLEYIDRNYSYEYMMLVKNNTLEVQICLQ